MGRSHFTRNHWEWERMKLRLVSRQKILEEQRRLKREQEEADTASRRHTGIVPTHHQFITNERFGDLLNITDNAEKRKSGVEVRCSAASYPSVSRKPQRGRSLGACSGERPVMWRQSHGEPVTRSAEPTPDPLHASHLTTCGRTGRTGQHPRGCFSSFPSMSKIMIITLSRESETGLLLVSFSFPHRELRPWLASTSGQKL